MSELDGHLDGDAAAHWRRVAEARREEHEALARRPLVRAAVALERRSAPAVARAQAAGRRGAALARRAGLAARAAPRRPRAVAALRELDPPSSPSPSSSPSPAAVLALAPDASGAAVERALQEASADVVVLVPAGTHLAPGAAERLAAAVRAGAAAAAPVVVHGLRPWSHATPVDGLVLAAGLDLVLHDGAPAVVAHGAATAVGAAEPGAVRAALATGLALDRRAVAAVGGVAPLGSLDAAAVELVDRLVVEGRRVALVADAVAIDERPLPSAAAIVRPLDPASPAWAAVVDRRGASLRRAATGAGRLEVALTIAAPSAKVAARWGDWHLASAVAAELGRLGHGATVRTIDRADELAARAADVHVVVRGLRAVRATPGQRQVLWIISHPLEVADAELDAAQLVLVASARHADALRARTATPVEVLLQATDHRRFRPLPPDPAHRHDVTIVAKSRGEHRAMVAAAVAAGVAPAIYGGGWEPFVDPALVVAPYVANEDLPVVYSSAGVVLNDHWDDMRRLGFVSNRTFDVLACGTPVISDHLPELVELLGDAVPTWRRPEELGPLVAADLADPAAARARAAAGRELVLAEHTFERRAAQLLELLARHDLLPARR
ncbi:MAG TPA: glycosyltransferase [Aquihabitans sp.]|nr:glycosyltransferase [Aquihabitans sp.]